MSLTAPKSDYKEFEKCPAGNHIAVCYVVCDLGMQPRTYEGVTTMEHQVRLSWEISSECMEDGRPFSMTQDMKLSMAEYKGNKSKLRKHIESWRGSPFTQEQADSFNLLSLIGKACMLNVVHKANAAGDKVYANIASIAPLPRGIAAPTPINDPIIFSLAGGGLEFDELPENLRNKINTAKAEPRYPDEDLPPPHPAVHDAGNVDDGPNW